MLKVDEYISVIKAAVIANDRLAFDKALNELQKGFSRKQFSESNFKAKMNDTKNPDSQVRATILVQPNAEYSLLGYAVAHCDESFVRQLYALGARPLTVARTRYYTDPAREEKVGLKYLARERVENAERKLAKAQQALAELEHDVKTGAITSLTLRAEANNQIEKCQKLIAQTKDEIVHAKELEKELPEIIKVEPTLVAHRLGIAAEEIEKDAKQKGWKEEEYLFKKTLDRQANIKEMLEYSPEMTEYDEKSFPVTTPAGHMSVPECLMYYNLAPLARNLTPDTKIYIREFEEKSSRGINLYTNQVAQQYGEFDLRRAKEIIDARRKVVEANRTIALVEGDIVKKK